MAHRSTVTGLGMALLCASCASSPGLREPWVYGISRAVYPSVFDVSRPTPSAPEHPTEGLAYVYAMILVLPFAIDTALLPITVPHDLICLN